MNIFFFMAGCCFAGMALGALSDKFGLNAMGKLLFILLGSVLATGLLSRVFL